MTEQMARSVSSTVYDHQFYQKMEGIGDYLRGTVGERFVEAFTIAKIENSHRILDLGTGRGEIAVLCAERGSNVSAVDYSSYSISTAKDFAAKNLSPEKFRKIDFTVMDAKHLDFPNQNFDRVFFLEILEHLYPEELKIVLLEIRRVLKTGGQLIISTGPNSLLIKPLILLGSLLTGRKAWPSRTYHVNEQNYFGLKTLLSGAGFRPMIKVEHGKNWLYGQIYEQSINPAVKLVARIANWLFDSSPFYFVRRLPLINRFLGTHFLCLCVKEEI